MKTNYNRYLSKKSTFASVLGVNKMKILSFLKKWTLPVAIVTGVLAYIIGSYIPHIDRVSPFINRTLEIVQPCLIFSMLFLTFCKIDLRKMRLSRWQFIITLLQVGISFILALITPWVSSDMQIWIEAGILCFICPTATAAAVVTEKLGGNISGTISYTILINIATACTIPVLLPILSDSQHYSFGSLATIIMARTFPLLIAPMVAAWIFRTFFPKITERINQVRNLAFYLWGVALSIAMGITAQSVAHTSASFGTLLGIALVSLFCCAFQFWAGKAIGKRFGESICAGQSFGQKNTVFAIWLGSSFMNPATAIAGGCYSIWHNLFNTWQIQKKQSQQT